jgi:uncharacterized membrane-anchored protein YitT (DUF2179 family)
MNILRSRYAYSVPWNLFLMTLGSVLFAIGLKSIAIPHGFITGGFSGLGLLLYYAVGRLSPGIWFILINIPVFIVGWIFVSRRFFYYSIYGMFTLSLCVDMVGFSIPVKDDFLAVLSGGALIGAGGGIILRSLGSSGGNDIIAVILNQKFNISMGSYYFYFNIILFTFSFSVMKVDQVLYSLAMSFVSSQVLDYFLSAFSQRKMVLVISDLADQIAQACHAKLNRGATFLNGMGSYTRTPKKVILTVVNNFQLKRLEEIVFTIDPNAFMITESTFSVIGRGFSSRKIY